MPSRAMLLSIQQDCVNENRNTTMFGNSQLPHVRQWRADRKRIAIESMITSSGFEPGKTIGCPAPVAAITTTRTRNDLQPARILLITGSSCRKPKNNFCCHAVTKHEFWAGSPTWAPRRAKGLGHALTETRLIAFDPSFHGSGFFDDRLLHGDRAIALANRMLRFMNATNGGWTSMMRARCPPSNQVVRRRQILAGR